MHLCGEIYKAERLERGKREEPARNGDEPEGVLLHPHTEHAPGCVGQPFFRGKKVVCFKTKDCL